MLYKSISENLGQQLMIVGITGPSGWDELRKSDWPRVDWLRAELDAGRLRAESDEGRS